MPEKRDGYGAVSDFVFSDNPFSSEERTSFMQKQTGNGEARYVARPISELPIPQYAQDVLISNGITTIDDLDEKYAREGTLSGLAAFKSQEGNAIQRGIGKRIVNKLEQELSTYITILDPEREEVKQVFPQPRARVEEGVVYAMTYDMVRSPRKQKSPPTSKEMLESIADEVVRLYRDEKRPLVRVAQIISTEGKNITAHNVRKILKGKGIPLRTRVEVELLHKQDEHKKKS